MAEESQANRWPSLPDTPHLTRLLRPSQPPQWLRAHTPPQGLR